MRQIWVDGVTPGSNIISDPDVDQFNQLNMSGRKKYYEQGYFGQNVTIAVIDSGCSPHKEFDTRLYTGTNMCTTGYTSDTSNDDLGHGTHVCGIIAGSNCGIAPKARILPVKVIDVMGDGKVTDIINALKWCRDWRGPHGERVDIINMSLSSKAEFFTNNQALLDEYHSAIKSVVDSGIAVIVAAGNTGKEQILYPAYFDEVITVGAVDIDKKVAFFTTRSKQVDVCQVGVDVLSTYLLDNKYKYDTGTSMASPHVAGIAALMVCKYKAMFGKPMPEPVLYEMLKMNTIDLDIRGVDTATGAGFCTLNPSTGKIIMKMRENDYNIVVNGKSIRSDAAPITVPPGRFMAPVRFLAENMGGQASYDIATKTATFEIDM